MRFRIFPYRKGSKSAKALAEGLGGKVLKFEGSTFIPKSGDVVINWGSSDVNRAAPISISADFYGERMLINNPDTIRVVADKLTFFQKMKEQSNPYIPDFWLNKEDIPDEAFPIVCRTVLNGHSGDGIVIADTRSDLVDCLLYVKYIKKAEEYRIHVGLVSVYYDGGPCKIDCSGGCVDCAPDEHTEVISAQKKARKLDVPDDEVNWKVRNLAGGFIYKREGVIVPSPVEEAARNTLWATGLDFGAVDVIWNKTQEKAYVLEVNTAPGLEGQTVQDYVRFFEKLKS